MKMKSKSVAARFFPMGGRQYELVEVDGPLPTRKGEVFPAQFDHAAGVLRISRTVPVAERAWVVAVAVSDACFQMWRPVPVIGPELEESEPPVW